MLSSKKNLFILIFTLLLPVLLSAQTNGDCECEDATLIVCYLSDDEFCPGTSGCGYSFDGRHMDDSLVPKLINSNNFGTDGIVPCSIETSILREVPSVQYILDRGCDIIFTGNFIKDTLTNQVNADITAISDNILNRIRDWSQLCPTNLVIVSQEEAKPWGYEVSNQNQNPNVSSNINTGLNIFNGPFGLVNSFNQGGSYQGVITDIPATGGTIIAVDNNGRPTVLLDSLTNDLIFGDIGIFCGGNVGQVSDGQSIINSNDRLACNIFALGCSIASASPSSFQAYELCPGEIVVRPNGAEVSASGIYIDTLLASNNCDSIVTTAVSIRDTIFGVVNYEGCVADNFNITINEVLYDESNPTGVEFLKTARGCDSIISVDLRYDALSNIELTDAYCANDDFELLIGNTVFNPSNLSGEVTLINAEGCDSIVLVDLSITPLTESFETFQICREDQISIDGVDYSVNTIETLSYSRIDQCDSLFNFEVIPYPDAKAPSFPSSVDLMFSQDQQIAVNTEPEFMIDWLPDNAVSCNDCPDPIVLANGVTDQLELIITDQNNCSLSYFIDLSYTCPAYIPNVISRNGQEQNSKFIIQTPCSVDAFEMSIYDRWGSLMYNSNDISQGWDGKVNGVEVQNGVYVYIVKIEAFGKINQIGGDLTVI